MFSLKGKRALVTGGSRGIGRGIALCLASQGARVAVNYHSRKEEAEAVVSLIREQGGEALAVGADVSSEEAVKEMMLGIEKEWGGLEILVNNAGIVIPGEVEKTTVESWDQVLATNLRGQFLCTREALRLMKPGAKVINLASVVSGGVGVGSAGTASYSASKGAVVALTESLAAELAPKGINVNAVAPGLIETEMTRFVTENKEMLAGLLRRVPKGRVGKPEEIGAAVVFLASDEAGYVDGTVLYVDGGWLAA